LTTSASSAAVRRSSRRVTGIFPPIPTPLVDGRLDLDSMRRLLDNLFASIDGVMLGGSLGEGASLSIPERETVIRTVADHFQGERSLVVSISDNSLEHLKRLSSVAGECEAALLALSCPNYFPNDLGMLEAYFGAVNDVASVDLCLYDNPYVTRTLLTIDDILAIRAAAPRITHVKMTDATLGKIRDLRNRLDVTVFAGDDAVLWHHLLSGAEGMMASVPMVYPERVASMWAAFNRGEIDDAFEEYRMLSPIIQVALSNVDYPAVIKAILHHRGIISSSEVRVPLVPLSTERLDEVIGALAD
jgi:4-hydroxy-tetrahydrodipicolinate synthase